MEPRLRRWRTLNQLQLYVRSPSKGMRSRPVVVRPVPGMKPRRVPRTGLVRGPEGAQQPGRPVASERRSASSARDAGPLGLCRADPLGTLPLEQPGCPRAAPPVREKLGRESGISGRKAAPCLH